MNSEASSLKLPTRLEQVHLDGARLFSDRKEMIKSIASNSFTNIAEIGVAFGDFSEFLLKTLKPTRFDAFDIFKMHQWDAMWGKDLAKTFAGRDHETYYRDRLKSQIDKGLAHVHCGPSWDKLAEMPDSFYDLIYVDGDHKLEAVKKDAAVSVKKIKPGGYLVFNDYIVWARKGQRYGIVDTVNDLCANHGWVITHFALSPQMFCDVIIQHP